MARPKRDRPQVIASVHRDVRAALDREAKGAPTFSHAVEAVLRRGLNLPPAASEDFSEEHAHGARRPALCMNPEPRKGSGPGSSPSTGKVKGANAGPDEER